MFQENRGLLDKNRTEGYLIEKGDFMDFRDLSYVLAIAKTQNITKAADSLYVTQPTLTKFLQNLEKEMGQKLFRKLGNRFVLTYAGERYVAKATEILNLKKELDQELPMIEVLWDIDPLDWATKDADTVVQRVLQKLFQISGTPQRTS